MNAMTPVSATPPVNTLFGLDRRQLRQDILTEQQDMAAERAMEEPRLRDMARLFQPDQAAELSGADRPNHDDFGDLVDATQLYAVDQLASGIFTDLTNPVNPWAAFTIEDKELARFHPVKLWFEAASQRVQSTLAPSRSRFYAEAPQWFTDMAVFGYGVMSSIENARLDGFTDRLVPVHQVYLAHGADGELLRVHRKWKLKGRRARMKWPDLSQRVTDNADATFVHAVFPNPRFREGAPGPLGAAFLSVYLCEQDDEFLRAGIFYEMPYHVVEWSRTGSRAYAHGPASRARPDAASLQVMQEAHMTAANFAARPPILSAAEDLVSVTDYAPGQWIYGAINEAGRPMVAPLAAGGDIRLSAEMSKQAREQISEAFHASAMMLINRPQMTATEVLGWQEERMRRMAPYITRVQITGLAPLLFRRFNVLWRAGAIPEPPAELQGQRLDIDYLSPMARVQKVTEARAVMNTLGAAAQIAQLQPEVADNIDGDAALKAIHDGFGATALMLRDPRQVDAIRQARAQQQQQGQQLQEAGQAVAIAAEAAHAQQAQTLAGGRSQPGA